MRVVGTALHAEAEVSAYGSAPSRHRRPSIHPTTHGASKEAWATGTSIPALQRL